MTDYSIYADFLARLQAATSEEEKSWMLMEFSLNQLSPTVREAVWAAAIPHQFDEKFLRTLLENNLTAEDWKTLLSQSYLEHLWNGLLLAKLFQDDPQRYRELNRRAANYCEQQNQQELRWRVTTLYHQVLADLDRIADKFDSQATDWWNDTMQLDKIEALIRPMLEEVHAHRATEKIAAPTFYWQGVLDDFYGRPVSAKNYLTQALQLFQQFQDEKNEANCIWRLGDVYLSLSDYEAARTQYQQALPLFQQVGKKLGEANCVARLGDVYLRLSDYEAARTQYQQALPLYQQIGSKHGEANCMRSLGEMIVEQEQINDAIATLKHAAELYHAIGLIVDEAPVVLIVSQTFIVTKNAMKMHLLPINKRLKLRQKGALRITIGQPLTLQWNSMISRYKILNGLRKQALIWNICKPFVEKSHCGNTNLKRLSIYCNPPLNSVRKMAVFNAYLPLPCSPMEMPKPLPRWKPV